MYAFSLSWPGEKLELSTVKPKKGSKIYMLGVKTPLKWEFKNDKLSIQLPARMQDPANRPCSHAWAFKITCEQVSN